MTFQPPPPENEPASSTPPPPPPASSGQFNPPPAPPAATGSPNATPSAHHSPMAGFDPKTVNQLDWGILGAGVLAFIFSFISYYSYDEAHCSTACVSVNNSAWHGFFGWFGMLLALIGSALVALDLFMPHVKLPFPNRLLGLTAYAVATLCVVIALFLVPDGSFNGFTIDSGSDNVDAGHGFGYWVSLIVIIAGLVLSFMRFTQTGGKLDANSFKRA